MRVQAETIEQLVANCEQPQLLREIYELILNNTEIEPYLFTSSSINLIGFGYHKADKNGVQWPRFAIAPQKNNVAIYVTTFKDGVSITTHYQEIFKKSNVSKGCIRIKSLNSEKSQAIVELFNAVIK